MKTYIPTFDQFINESLNEGKDEFVSATLSKNSGTFKKGDKVKVNALDYTERGANEMVAIIKSDGKKSQILKGDLDVKI